ncbi:transmembrane protein 186, partial [Chrysoperla carnea]|uniref:transmembrane protein 186 n=1 Tax=Chrysoperla carnea TaxID=189513 RepID=UPI001D08948C
FKKFNQIKILPVLLINQTPKFLSSSTKRTDNTEFKPIYKFPYIRLLQAINKLKIYQGITTTIAIPLSGIFQFIGVIDENYLPIIAALGVTGTISLTVLGKVTENFIGFMYINKDGTLLRISYLDFWSRRKNVDIPIDDIVPLSDMSTALTDKLYLKLSRYSTEDIYKINLQYGEILNWECVDQVLGPGEQK